MKLSTNLEEWKKCEDFPNYEVSNYGNVRSIDRTISSKHNSIAFRKGKILKLSNSGGYKSVECNGTTIGVHRLVAIAFIPNLNNLSGINHKDGNKINNFSSNLEWSTQKDNVIHAFNNNLSKTGELHTSSKLSNLEVIEIRSKYASKLYTHSKLAKEYNISISQIGKIINYKARKRG